MFREIKERRRKTVPLAPELVAILRGHRAAQAAERERAANLWEEHDLVFCQPNGRPIGPRADWQEWADILDAAGIPHQGVHAMRHSAATIALGEGVALAVVQEVLGHSDIRVTRLRARFQPARRGRRGAHGPRSLLRYCYENCYEAATSTGRQSMVSAGQAVSRLSESNRRPTHYECVALAD